MAGPPCPPERMGRVVEDFCHLTTLPRAWTVPLRQHVSGSLSIPSTSDVIECCGFALTPCSLRETSLNVKLNTPKYNYRLPDDDVSALCRSCSRVSASSSLLGASRSATLQQGWLMQAQMPGSSTHSIPLVRPKKKEKKRP